MKTETTAFEIDLVNLMAVDLHHQFPSNPSSREELMKECIARGTELVQAIANNLFNLPSTRDSLLRLRLGISIEAFVH
ncbi:hypothetical protein ABKV19_016164 [Rosa sericea]